MRLAERSAEDAEIMGVDEDPSSVDPSPSGHHPVGVRPLVCHAETGGPVPAERFDLGESACIEQDVDAFASGELASGMLPFGAGMIHDLLTATGQRRRMLEHGPIRQACVGPNRDDLRSARLRGGPGHLEFLS